MKYTGPPAKISPPLDWIVVPSMPTRWFAFGLPSPALR